MDARHDDRVRELDRMTKRELLGIVYTHAQRANVKYVVGGPHLYSKDELINAILEFEYPQENTGGSDAR